MHTPILSADGLRKYYTVDGERIEAVGPVSLEVEAGEFVCLIGPSGSGKSTLLRLISGLEAPDHGRVHLPRGEVSMVFQNFALFPWLSVSDNVGFGLRMRGTPESEREKRASDELARIGLAGSESKHPRELSGGMKQRVGIARALATDPKVLFMDEPFSALDAFTAENLRTETLGIWQEQRVTVVMVTHLVEEAVEMADRVLVMSPRPGQIIDEIRIDLPRPRDKRSEAFYHHVDTIAKLITG